MFHIKPNRGKRDGKSSTQRRAQNGRGYVIVTSLEDSGIFPLQISNVTRVGQTDAWKAKYANEVLLVGW